jgi:hypothetical protein
MIHEERSPSEPGPTEASSAEASESIPDRIQALREKTSRLSATLDGIEKSLQEAAGETKE